MLNKKFIDKPLMVFGNKLQTLIKGVRKFPHVVNPRNLCLESGPDEILKRLQSRA